MKMKMMKKMMMMNQLIKCWIFHTSTILNKALNEEREKKREKREEENENSFSLALIYL